MPAAILDVDLARDLRDVSGLDSYTRAHIVVRFTGIPVGHFCVPVLNGGISKEELTSRAVAAALPALSRRWLEHRLNWAVRDRAAALPSATIAICTRERPEDLVRTLKAVVDIAGREHPVLVIDNRPTTDSTPRVVSNYTQVRYIREDTPGLNAARNRALREAATELVAFTDDDATPEEGWLQALRCGFGHRLVMGVTGLTLPLELETPAQEWFERSSPFGRGYFRHEFDPLHCSPQSAGQVGAGANMALRRDVLDRVGPFDERLDAGTPARSGGDHDMFARILASGYRLLYDPAAVSRHRHRRTWPELRETIRGYGTGVYAMWTGRIVEHGDLAVLRQAAWWFLRRQGPSLVGALTRRPDAIPLDLIVAELAGCVQGPFAWFRSRRLHRPAA